MKAVVLLGSGKQKDCYGIIFSCLPLKKINSCKSCRKESCFGSECDIGHFFSSTFMVTVHYVRENALYRLNEQQDLPVTNCCLALSLLSVQNSISKFYH